MVEAFPPKACERPILAEAIDKFGKSWSIQTALEAAASYQSTPSKWYFLRRAFGRLKKHGIIDWNPLSSVQGPKMAPKAGTYITDQDYQRILEVSEKSPIRYLVLSMWNTGLAMVDACLLDWAEIDPDEWVITKTREKMSKRRAGGQCTIPLDVNGPFVALLRARLEVKDTWTGHYPSVNGHHYVDQWCATRYLRGFNGSMEMMTEFKRLVRLAGCPAVRPHDFRRTSATNLVRASDPVTASLVTGHKSLDQLKRYVIPIPQDIRSKIQSLHGH